MKKPSHPSLIPLSMVEIVNAFGISLLVPVLPTISKQFGGGYLMYGILLSIYALFQFFSAPLWGSLSDRFGRKKILLLSQRGTLMSWVFFGYAWFVPSDIGFLGISLPLWIILGARIFDGITAGNNAVINAYISDISSNTQEKVKYFGILGAMAGIGVMVGPLLGGFSADFSAWGTFGTITSAAVLSLGTLIAMRKRLPESPHKPSNLFSFSLREFVQKINVPRDIFVTSQLNTHFGPLWLLIGVFFTLFLGYTTIYILHATDVLGFSAMQIGRMGVGVGIIFGINQLWLIPAMSKTYKPYHMLLLGHIMMALGLGLMTFTTGIWDFLASSGLIVTGVAWCMTLFNTIVSHYGSSDNEGYILGLKESVIAGASIVAPLIGAALYKVFDQDIFIIYAFISALMILIIYSQLYIDEQLS